MAYVLGSHDPIKDHERRIGFIARSGLPLLIEGECGTGKEALAELVHELNGASGEFGRILCRQTGPVVNLAAGNGNGAVDLSQTYASARGTIFLKNVQVLLGAMQEPSTGVGSTPSIPSRLLKALKNGDGEAR